MRGHRRRTAAICASGAATTKARPNAEHRQRDQQVHHLLSLEHDRRAREQPEALAQAGELAEGDDRSRERHRADERADEQLDAIAGRNRVGDVEGRRVVDDGDRRSAPRRGRPASASPATSSGICVISTRLATSQPMTPPTARAPSARSTRWVIVSVDDDGDGHAEDAEAIAAPSGERMGQTLERQDEEDAGDEVRERDLVGGHATLCFTDASPSAPSS